MRNIRNVVAASAAVAVIAFAPCANAQDDLDALLKDLEAETAKKPAQAAPAPEAASAAAKADESKPAEAAKEAKAEEKPAEAAAEEKAEEEKPAEVAKEEKAEEKPAEAAAEEKAEEEKPAEVAKEEKAEEKPAEVAAEEKSEEEKPAEKKTATIAVVVAPAAPAQAKPVEAKSVEAKPVAKPVRPDAELIENLKVTEQLRRASLDDQARREVAAARECMGTADYNEAIRHYGAALKLLNDRPGSVEIRRECNEGVAEGLYRSALAEFELGRPDKAIQLMEKAREMRHPKANRMLEKWQAADDTGVNRKTDLSDIKHRKNEEDYKSDRVVILRHLKRARQYLGLRDINKALDEVEAVLAKDPYNQEAIRVRNSIQKKRQTILEQERKASRDGMIADVDAAWRPPYAVNAAQLDASTAETVKKQTGDDPERTQEQDIEHRMKEMRLPTISFKPPATIIDAVEFFRQASRDYDRPDIPIEKRGFNFVLRTPQGAIKAQPAGGDAADDFSANADEGAAAPANGLEPIQTITASDITFYEALKLVCDSVGYKFIVRGPVVMVMPNDMSTAELLSRKYNVPEAFVERVNTASEEMKTMGGFGGNGGGNKAKANDDAEDAGEGRDWKAFFEEMGVKWPEGSSIKHIKALGKLYVRNTRENLAEFEKVLDELGGQPQLIEIETRFVEVSQEDLNSLGFEWILNSDYSLNLGNSLGKALGIKNGVFGSESGSTSFASQTAGKNSFSSGSDVTSTIDTQVQNGQSTTLSNLRDLTTSTGSSLSSGGSDGSSTYSRTVPLNSKGSGWIQGYNDERNLGVNAFGGTSSGYGNGNRYLSTSGNHISGSGNSLNDQFMRVNAFLGSADLSMILHMLSQRSDTDLLSAPKVVTKSGENAVIKVVTEYIYPTDYDVQLQSSQSSSSGSSGGSSSAILAVVEPQNFTMREVGVILDVTPTYSEANGGTIDLELKPQVVQFEKWQSYGMRIPFTGNPSSGMGVDPASLFNWIPGATEKMADAVNKLIDAQSDQIASAYVDSAIASMNPSTITYYDAPMDQPFFNVRSIESKVSITPGATVVMGGLITETRKAMDDKVPFLGDLPYIGRLFRSHAEQTIKRNLLIFVTGRLITPSGRELKMGEAAADGEAVKPAPAAQ